MFEIAILKKVTVKKENVLVYKSNVRYSVKKTEEMRKYLDGLMKEFGIKQRVLFLPYGWDLSIETEDIFGSGH